MDIIYRLIITAIICYLLLGLYMYFFQERFIFMPGRGDFYACPSFTDEEKVEHDGTRMYHRHVSDKLIVFYHGNAGSACDRSFIAKKIANAGYSFVLVEYAGYAGAGKATLKNVIKDADNVIDYTKKYKHITTMGVSLGTGPASYHSTKAEVDTVVLISPYTSILDIAKKTYPFFPVRLLLKFNFDNNEWLKDYNGKVVLVTGTKDSVIPVNNSLQLYKEINTEKHLIKIDAGHNYIFDEAWPEIKKELS